MKLIKINFNKALQNINDISYHWNNFLHITNILYGSQPRDFPKSETPLFLSNKTLHFLPKTPTNLTYFINFDTSKFLIVNTFSYVKYHVTDFHSTVPFIILKHLKSCSYIEFLFPHYICILEILVTLVNYFVLLLHNTLVTNWNDKIIFTPVVN